MRSIFFWEAGGLSLDRANPYGALLAQAMAKESVKLEAWFPQQLTAGWLREHQGDIDCIHLNWPHHFYHGSNLEESLARCADWISHLALARDLGYRIIWTVHNLYPHDTPWPDLDRMAQTALAHLATAIIVHCRQARELVQRHFGRSRAVFEIPHGHFIDAYPNTISSREARARLGIPEAAFVYLAFGNLKPYKGLERLVQTFAALPGDELVLLLAVKVVNDYSAGFVESARVADPRIVLKTSRFFPNEEFQLFLNAADVVAFPFRDILTSGSVITALSFARPVIVPAIGCLPKLVDDQMGIVYNPADEDGLLRALADIRTRDLQGFRKAAFDSACSLAWEPIARRTLEAYQIG